MRLHHRMVGLLAAFAAFAVLATFATIYSVRLHSEDALASLRQNQSEAVWIERLRVTAREQQVRLGEIVAGMDRVKPTTERADTQPTDESFDGQFAAFLDQLGQVAQFTLARANRDLALDLLTLKGETHSAVDDCLTAVKQNDLAAARDILRNRLTGPHQPLPDIDLKLQLVSAALDAARTATVDELSASHMQMLILSLAIAALGVVLVFAGLALTRRWILVPIQQLQRAAGEFAAGNLAYRVPPLGAAEVGELGSALNQMATALSDAQASLRTSETKYRALFSNLRDATLLCNSHGVVLETQDGDTRLLDRFAPFCTDRAVSDLWRTAGGDPLDWPSILGRVLTERQRVRVSDVRLHHPTDVEQSAVVELLVFPMELGAQYAVAIVLHDITVQRRSELQLRRTEAIEATVTLARGVAHDFSSLLSSAIGSLSSLGAELREGRAAELVRRSLRVCGQAVSLARTLLTFAGGNPGNPEVLPLGETVDVILNSLDERWLEKIELQTALDEHVQALIDRDQFTEIVLNLVRNACESMADGGRLQITLAPGRLPTAAGDGPATHAILTFADSGCGLTPEVQARIFEPFFTTKQSGQPRSRGLGLAVVYAAVKNAGGLIQVRSQPGAGATFLVWLPLAESVGLAVLPATNVAAQPGGNGHHQ